MANYTAKLFPRGHAKRQVMQPVTLLPGDTSPTLTLTVVDQNGNPIGVSAGSVSSTMTSDNPPVLTISPGADSLHYNGACPVGAGGLANVAATLDYLGGSPTTTFGASVAVTVPGSQTPTDLTITIS
jgi:hypothetical protein